MLTLLILFAYLLGSIPFGKIIGRRHGVDLQKVGSGNIGFANAVRTLGWRPALPVLVGDLLKGYLPTFLALRLFGEPSALIVATAAILGHIFSMWLRLRGGKGIATGLGVMLALDPLLVLPAGAIYLVTFAVVRQSAPGSLLAAWSLPLLCLATANPHSLFYAVLAAIVTWAHRTNLAQMRRAMLGVA
jgi:glycerol-3-phosphate acyltransferase PlsY